MKNKSRYPIKTAVIVFIILVCALGLRLYNINKYDMWFDELMSDLRSYEIITSRALFFNISPLTFFLKGIERDPQPPFYYMLVYIYSFLFGGGKLLRGLSVIFSMLSLGMFYKLARLFFNRRMSIYALLIMVLNPLQIWYAQEARSYTMVLFFAISFIYFYTQALKTNKPFYWISFFLSSICGIYTSYYFIFLLIGSGFTLLFFKDYRPHIKKWIITIIGISILFLPFMFMSLGHLNYIKNDFWLPPPSLKWLIWIFANFNLGYSANLGQFIAGLVLFGSLFMYGMYSYYRSNKKGAITLLLFFLSPFIGAYIFSKTIAPIYITRQLLICSPLYYLFVAKGIYGIKRKIPHVLALVFVVLLLSSSLVNYYSGFMLTPSRARFFRPSHKMPDFYIGVHEKKNYSGLMNYINKEFKKGDILVATDVQSMQIIKLWYYRSLRYKHSDFSQEMIYLFFYPRLTGGMLSLKTHNLQKQIIEIKEKDRLYAAHVLKNYYDNVIEDVEAYVNNGSFKRIWLISSAWNKDESFSLNSLRVWKYMRRNYKEIRFMKKDGIHIGLFAI